MKSNKNGFYWLTILVLGLVAGFAVILSGMAPISDDPVISEGSVRPAVFARLSQIRQGTEPKLNDETFNANEEDAEEVTRNLPLDVIPQIIPQHVDSYDRISATNVDRMTAVKPPLVKKLFTGLKNTGGNQPDSILAVGPSHVLLAVNSNIGIYTKDGRRRFITSFYNWFEPLVHTSGGSIIFDPRLLYDQYSHHYIFLCTTRRADHRSWYLLSVSKTSDPEGEWAFWALDMQINGHSSRLDLWADFPRLGVDQNALYVTANMYTFGTYIFRYSKIRVLRKRDVYAFGSLPYFEFAQMIDAAGVYAHSIEPAHSFDSAPAEFLVNTRMDAANKITLWKITTPDAGKPVLVKIPVKVSSFQAPPPAIQKGGGATINTATEGTGVLSVTYRNGFVYTVQPVAKNWGSRRVSALRIYQMDYTGKLVQETTYGSDGVDYYMPAISVDSRANVVIAFSRSSAKDFAGFYAAGRTSSALPGQFSPSIPLQRGLANYQIIFRGTNIARWGDYNGLTLAPDDTFWAFGEYAASSTQWQTVVGQLGY